MGPDVINLAHFYDSRLGKVASRIIRHRVRDIWHDLDSLRLLGVGYATPYLQPFREETERTLAVMPVSQGANHWPGEGDNLVVMTEDIDLPFPDSSIDRVLLVHGLETADQGPALLQEIWRILTPPGRLIVVVPHRRGIWAWLERTPFGHGRPYSKPQIKRLLCDNGFSSRIFEPVLYTPPTSWRLVLRFNRLIEKFGRRWSFGLPGVLVVEAGKQIYGATADRAPVKRLEKSRPAHAMPNGISTQNQ